MIEELKPYPAYRKSGQAWLGSLPAHWQVKPCRALFIEVRDRNPGNEPMLSVTIGRGVIPQARQLEGTGKRDSSRIDKSNYKLVRPGDVAYNKMRAWQGALGRSTLRGIISPAYVVQRPRDLRFGMYFHHLARTPAFAKEAERWSYGITSDMWSLRPEHFKMIYCAVPPPEEQEAIVRFLDHANRRIDQFIRAKKKLIALLNEQKQAIIHRAVTRGIDPRSSTRDTDSRWFPSLPSHWEVLPLARVITAAIDGPHFSPSYLDNGIPFLSARNIKADRWSLDDAKFISEADYEEFSRRVKPEVGDVLYTKGGTTGVARAVDLTFKFQVWVHVAVLKLLRSRVEPRFLAYALNSPRCYEQAQLFTRGATNQDLGLGRMKRIEIPLPPTLDEQRSIVGQLDGETLRFTTATRSAEREIELAREYRTRLIADVVTGQLDVRSAAASLPAVEPEAAPTETEDDDTDIEDGEAA